MSTSGIMSSVPQRLPGFQRVLYPLQRFSFATQFQKRLSLEVQQILFADHRLMWQRSAGEHAGERPSDDGVVIANPAGAPGEVHTECECGHDAFAADENARAKRRALIAFAH